jgi:hypothetical protein
MDHYSNPEHYTGYENSAIPVIQRKPSEQFRAINELYAFQHNNPPGKNTYVPAPISETELVNYNDTRSARLQTLNDDLKRNNPNATTEQLQAYSNVNFLPFLPKTIDPNYGYIDQQGFYQIKPIDPIRNQYGRLQVDWSKYKKSKPSRFSNISQIQAIYTTKKPRSPTKIQKSTIEEIFGKQQTSKIQKKPVSVIEQLFGKTRRRS